MAERMAPRISFTYAAVGLTWISGSSAVVWADTATGPLVAEIIKGATFVVVTASLIYWLIRKEENKREAKNRRLAEVRCILQGILEESDDLFAAWNTDKRLTAVNSKFRDDWEMLFGRLPGVGDPLAGICDPSHAKYAEFDADLDRLLGGERFVKIHYIPGQDKVRWYETSFTPLLHDGHIIGGFIISRDTTERVLVENATRDREQRLQAIVDNLADYVVIVSPDLTSHYYSAGLRKITGYSEDQTLSMPLETRIHPDDIQKLHTAITSSIQTGQRVRGLEYRRRHADGLWYFHSLNGGRLEQGGEALFLAVVQDVTERKRAEDKLGHSAKLATVGEFAAGLAHELAHPVAVIRLAAEAALEQANNIALTDEYLNEQLSLLDDQAMRMAALIEHVRAFSRKSDAPDISFVPQEVIKAVGRMVKKQMEIEGIVLRTEVCDEVHAVIGNPIRLEEVLLNLVSNACAAIRARRAIDGDSFQGEIFISCGCCNGDVCISVSDNGSGIAKVDEGRIFEPFFTTKEIGDGLGLGLSISLTIVKSFGGQLTFTSEPGSTKFLLSIPRINIAATPIVYG